MLKSLGKTAAPQTVFWRKREPNEKEQSRMTVGIAVATIMIAMIATAKNGFSVRTVRHGFT